MGGVVKYDVQMSLTIREWTVQTVEAESEEEAIRLARKAAKRDPDCWCDRDAKGRVRVHRVSKSDGC